MLPSLKFFGNDPCPYYKAGLCDRPHCPFRHGSSGRHNTPVAILEDEVTALPSNIKDEKLLFPLDSEIPTTAANVKDPVVTPSKEVKLEASSSTKEVAQCNTPVLPASDPKEIELNEERKRLEAEYENMLLGSDDDDDDDIEIDADVAEQFLLPEDTDYEDPAELVDACYKEWLRSKNEPAPPPKSPTKEVNAEVSKHKDPSTSPKKSEPENCISPKKRLAHHSENSPNATSRISVPKKIVQLTPAQTLVRRFEEMRKSKKQMETNTVASTKPVIPVPAPTSKNNVRETVTAQKRKLDSQLPQPAQKNTVPKPSQVSQKYSVPIPKPSLPVQKNTVSQIPQPAQRKTVSQSSQAAHKPTLSQTVEKGTARKAHAPVALPVQHKPMIGRDSIAASKIPYITRQQTLEQLFKACEGIYNNHEEASQRAIAEELVLSKHKSKPVYVGSSANCLKRLRDEAAKVIAFNESMEEGYDGLTEENSVSNFPNQSLGNSQSNGTVSVNKPRYVDPKQMSDMKERRSQYQAMKKYILTPEQLTENGYPRTHPSGDRGRITTKSRKSNNIPYSGDSSKRVCDRCRKEFIVALDGTPCVKEMCIYHHGRNFKRRVQGNYEGRYTCCDGESNSKGCTVANLHVSVHPSDELYGFVTAVKEPGKDETMGNDPWDIVALDCEMVYTTYGNELARATFMSVDKKVLYDELVKPIHPIIDYNTRYSGITEEMMKNVTTSLTDVQAVMLTRVCPNTIMIGHSLESDLVALKIKHDCVVDTSVIMPHRLGPPYKRALRNLASDCLGKIIQTGEHGHDSEEDAVTALEIVLWKIKGDRMLQNTNDSKRPKY